MRPIAVAEALSFAPPGLRGFPMDVTCTVNAQPFTFKVRFAPTTSVFARLPLVVPVSALHAPLRVFFAQGW